MRGWPPSSLSGDVVPPTVREAVLEPSVCWTDKVRLRERDLVVGEHVALGGQRLDEWPVLRLDLVLDVGQAPPGAMPSS